MIDRKWDLRFLEMAKLVASWSKDPSTKVGALIVDPFTREIHSTGFNGFPRGVSDTDDRYQNRELKYQLVVHAEENAIISAGRRSMGGALYVWPSFYLPPICSRCCASAIQAGISEIVGLTNDNPTESEQRWKASIDLARQMCDESGLIYRGVSING